MECIICSEEITAATGRTVLGCGHEFHMVCVARWFCRQEGASSCPCCRRESGAYDDLPRAAAEAEEGEDDESDDVSGWSDEDDDASVVTVEIFWRRDEAGVWRQMFRETATTIGWNPVTEPDAVPEEMGEGATSLQRLWRGHRVRQQQQVAAAVEGLLALKVGPLPAAEADPMSMD